MGGLYHFAHLASSDFLWFHSTQKPRCIGSRPLFRLTPWRTFMISAKRLSSTLNQRRAVRILKSDLARFQKLQVVHNQVNPAPIYDERFVYSSTRQILTKSHKPFVINP